MNRSYVIAGVLVVAVLALAGMVWTNFLGLRDLLESESATQERLMSELSEIASRGGHVATFSEANVKSWQVPGGHQLERFSLNDKGAVFARLTSGTQMDPQSFDWPNQGMTWLLTKDFNNKTNGRKIEIGVVARQGTGKAADSIYLMYATQQSGNSGWKKIPLGTRFELKKIEFQVPSVPGGFTNPPILVLNADPAGKGKSVEILGAYVQAVE